MRRKIAFWMMLLGIISPLSSIAAEGQSQDSANLIRVTIVGLRNDKGVVLCALFASASAFPGKPEQALARTHSDISKGTATCEFRGIAPGRYAVSAFHDENSNGKIDSNFIGIPKEGLASSNDAKGRFGPPKFDAAAFQFTGGKLELNIKTMYL